MKAVCKAIAASAPAATTAAILSPQKFSSQLRDVAKVFSDLQDARHRADYDLSEKFTRTQTLSFVWQAEFAFLTWNLIRNRDEARVFLAALLLQKRWSR